MRRILFLLAVLLLVSSPSWAATKYQSFTVAQLGQWLTSMHGQPDGKVAKDLETTIVTERVSAAQLVQGADSGADAENPRHQLAADGQGTGDLSPWLARVLRRLSNALGAGTS